MRIGATQLFFADKSVAESLAYAKECGYDSLELVVRDTADLKPDTDDASLIKMRQEAERLGVTIPSLVPQAANTLASPCPVERAKAVCGLRKAIHIAEMLGADTLLAHPGQLTAQVRYDVMYENVKYAMLQVAPDAERARVSIGVENVWNKFLLSPLEAKRFAEEVGSAYIGVYFDVGNFVPWAYPEHWVDILGPVIKKVHFKDFKRSDHKFVPLCEGDVDWPALMNSLRAVGYDTEVIQEVAGDPEGMKSTAATMRKILSM
jgi:L-ribulose-5-phosphate 3-epimerase